MIQIGRYIYELAPTGDWLIVGEIINGIDSEYVSWYS